MAALEAHIVQMNDILAAAKKAFHKHEYEEAANLQVKASLVGEFILGRSNTEWFIFKVQDPKPKHLCETTAYTYSTTQNASQYVWVSNTFEIPSKSCQGFYCCKRFYFQFFDCGAHQYLMFEIRHKDGIYDEGCHSEED